MGRSGPVTLAGAVRWPPVSSRAADADHPARARRRQETPAPSSSRILCSDVWRGPSCPIGFDCTRGRCPSVPGCPGQGVPEVFATLIGTNSGAIEHQALFDRLRGIAIARGFIPPDASVCIQADGSLAGWSLEQRGPRDREADFLLAVTNPRVPGVSPIFPVSKTISGPLFAVVVLESAFVRCIERRPARCRRGAGRGSRLHCLQHISRPASTTAGALARAFRQQPPARR